MADINSQEVQDIASDFTGGVFAIFFPNLNTTAGSEFLRSLICYMLECYPDLATKCPKSWKCFYLNWLAFTLSNWPVSFTAAADEEDAGGIVVDDLTRNQDLRTYLKKETIGGKTCEFDIYEHKCQKCDEDIKSTWKLAFETILSDCACADSLWLGGGSFFDKTPDKGCGCGDKTTGRNMYHDFDY